MRQVCARVQVSPNAVGEQLEPMPIVRDNNIDQALRVLKKMQREGMFREMKRVRFYEKPSEQQREKRPKRCAAPASRRYETD